MYFNLFNKITDAIKILQKAQQEAEDAYIENEDEPYILSEQGNDEEVTLEKSDKD